MKLLLSLLALAYAVSPFDLLPDFFLGLGWVDDIILLGLLWWFLYSSYRGKKTRKGDYRNQRSNESGKEESRYEGLGSRGDSQHRNPYSVLGVSEGASMEEIKEAYRRLANQYHPDKVQHLGEEFRELAEVRFKEIQEAYQELRVR